jgi:serine/threonine-protein kinase
MRKHVSKKITLVPPDHLNAALSSGFGEVIETMMAKDREARYLTPDDLILDLECLTRGEAPRIASQRVDALSALAEGESYEGLDGPAESAVVRSTGARSSGGAGTSVVILSVLLAISVLLNIVQLLTR